MTGRNAERHIWECASKFFSQDRYHRVFGTEVISVDQIDPHARSVQKLMILDIGSHIGIAAFFNGSVQSVTAGAAHNRKAIDFFSCIYIPQTIHLQDRFAALQKADHRHRLRECSDPTAAVGIQRSFGGSTQNVDQNIIDATG